MLAWGHMWWSSNTESAPKRHVCQQDIYKIKHAGIWHELRGDSLHSPSVMLQLVKQEHSTP